MLQTKPALLGLMLLSAFCQAVPGGYVALGDGYSSGFGSGNYDLDPGPCHRSSLAFPALWAKSHNQTSFSFAACNGASIEDVATLQLGNVSADTAIISLTIGADNVGLTGALSACAGGTEDSCRDQTNTAKGYISAELPGRLDALYNATRTKAPQAKIVVLGYPWYYSLNSTCPGFSITKRQAANSLLDELDSAIQQRATAHGFVFEDVRGKFAPHEVCSKDPWLNGLLISSDYSFSVNAVGHKQGYLPILAATLEPIASNFTKD